MNRFRVNDVVNWFEGYSQRQRFGLIEQVHELAGWPAEYTVRAFKKDGNPSKQVRRMYESELGRGMVPDTCCTCQEPLGRLLTCASCLRSVCSSCARHDGADDSYCPDCWTDMQSFLAEGVNGATPEGQRDDPAQLSAPLPSDGQEQLQGQG